jgi:site-specific DNA-methyltransferase (adenine-specific)
METMKAMPDKAFDLAIVDPPYGIGINKGGHTLAGNGNFKGGNFKVAAREYKGGEWDNEPPSKEYFRQLFRVSKNQIVWGANHFIERMPYNASGWIVWDKDNGESYQADCELAWTSFDKAVRKFIWRWWGLLQQNMKNKDQRIHPTQKPVALYKWLLTNYAKLGQTILDTHLGSGSIAIACHDLGFDLTGYEIDADYFQAAKDRLERHQKQGVLDMGEIAWTP